MDVIKGRDETLLRVVMLNTSLLSNKPKTIDTQFGFNQCENNCRPRSSNNGDLCTCDIFSNKKQRKMLKVSA